MGERRILLSRALQEQRAFQDNLAALQDAGLRRMATQSETLTVGYHLPPLPPERREYVPCREGKLNSPVKRRSVSSRRGFPRWSRPGYNSGRRVTYY